jgi:hypothetical protein
LLRAFTNLIGDDAFDWLFVQSSTGRALSEQHVKGGMITQPQGFAAVEQHTDQESAEWIATVKNLAHDGSPTSQQTFINDEPPSFTVDPSGGIVVIRITASPAGRGPWQIDYERLDKSGSVEAGPTRVATGTSTTTGVQAVAGVTLSSHTLLVYRWDQTCQAIWLARDGHALTGPFAAPNCDVQRFHPLLDGGLVAETFHGFRGTDLQTQLESEIHDAQTQWDPLPAFLAGKSLREFFMLPGGRGYALRENGTNHSLQTFAPAGNACESVTRPEFDDGPLTIGRDGTLLVQDLRNKGCTFYWWPQLWR